MSKFVTRTDHIHNPADYQTSQEELRRKLGSLYLQHLYLWDSNYWYVSLEDWGKVLKDVTFGMPKYTKERFDCSNFAMLTSARVSETYKLNTCGICVGDSPWGYHGFNLILAEDGLYYFEPQTGDVYSVTENSGYRAHIVILG